MLVFASAMYASSWAQCSTPPMYLNLAYPTDNGFACAFYLKQPVCDSYSGEEIQWRGATDSYWSDFTADSISNGGDLASAYFFDKPLNAGVRYQWRVRMITYRPNGKSLYSDWTKGKNFTPEVLAASGCTYPGPLCLFEPGSSDVSLLFNNNTPPGWDYPTKSKLEYKIDGTSDWTKIRNIDPNSFVYFLNNLIPATTYNWRMSNNCDIDGNSVWQNGPDFTTASLAAKVNKNNAQKQTFFIKASQIKQYADDETADQVTPDILKVTPNPASSQINISLSTFKTGVASMMIKDLAGNVKWSASNVNIATLKNMTVNVSNFMPGIYSLQVIGIDNTMISQKIIISR